MRRPVVPPEAVTIIDEIVELTTRREKAEAEADDLLRQRDEKVVLLWDVAGKAPTRSRGLTYGQIERVTQGKLRESNIRRIIERKR